MTRTKKAVIDLRAELIWREDDFDTTEEYDAFKPTVESVMDTLGLEPNVVATGFQVVDGQEEVAYHPKPTPGGQVISGVDRNRT